MPDLNILVICYDDTLMIVRIKNKNNIEPYLILEKPTIFSHNSDLVIFFSFLPSQYQLQAILGR